VKTPQGVRDFEGNMTLYCKPNDPAVAVLLQKTVPGYTGKQVAVNVHQHGGIPLTSYWSGGTRDYHTVIRLADMTTWTVPENGSGFTAVDRAFPAGFPVELPAPGFVVVTHTTGNYHAVSIHVHQEDAAKLIPAPCDVTWAEKVVLVATRSMKSSYAGKDRWTRANEDLTYPAWGKIAITRLQWDAAKASLISRGLLNKAGAITTEGRNAAGSQELYALKPVPLEVQNAA